MNSECLPFKLIPHTTKLFLDYLYDFDRVRHLYARPPRSAEWMSEEAAAVLKHEQRHAQVANILERQNRRYGCSAKTLENIERLKRGACAAVTGQQVGFLGGPLFSVLKALTAVRVSEQANAVGVDCVPVFWLATEDHDFEEIRSAVVQDSDGGLHTISLDAQHQPGAPVRDVVLGQASEAQIEEVVRLLADPEIGQAVREAYRPGVAVGEAFGRLFANLFARYGVILLDAADPDLHHIAAPVYRDAIEKSEALDNALLERGHKLQASGYHEQVKVTPSSTLLFGMVDGARTPIHREDGRFTLGTEKIDKAELLARIDAHPEQFSPNVLLRPVVQDYLLPTLVYCGGPAEVAYFAQAGVVYQHLLGRVTPILPRFSATLVDARAQRLLQKYQLRLPDLFHGEAQVREMLAERSLPADLKVAFDGASSQVERLLGDLQARLQTLDPTLVRSAAKAGNKIRHQLDRLRQRTARAEALKGEIISRHAQYLEQALFPHKDLQERVICGISFLAHRGDSVLDVLHDAVARDCPDHQIVFI